MTHFIWSIPTALIILAITLGCFYPDWPEEEE